MEVRYRFGVAILKIVGRLVTGAAPFLRTSVSELVAKRRVAVLISMAAVTDMDAHGIGELAASLLTVTRHEGQTALIAPSKSSTHFPPTAVVRLPPTPAPRRQSEKSATSVENRF